MKKLVFIFACILMAGISFQSCGTNDEQVQKNVQDVLTRNSYGTISSNVHNGIVTLTGSVDSEQKKSSIGEAVRNAKGVKSVMNNIMVDEPAPEPAVDRYEGMRSSIVSQIRDAGFDDVNVEVVDGEVILTGDLDRSDLTRVMQIANEANPTKVTNNITLR